MDISLASTFQAFPFSIKSGDGNVLPYVATIKETHTHSNNPNVPITLCVGHSNQFICALCDKFYK